jgi:hypothetical protein
MSLSYGTLEEVHGGSFGKRIPITRERDIDKNEAIAKPEFTSLAQRSADSIEKNKAVVDSVASTLPLDREASTENFTVHSREPPATKRMAVREKFSERPISHADAAAEDKLSRILRLIEQNRTGYERPVIQDMVLYVFTGVFFLFTFDTFVVLGKSMRTK